MDGAEHAGRFLLADDYHHADAHVEDLVHLGVGNLPPGLQQPVDRQHVPCAAHDDGVAVVRQHAGDVVHKPAAGDVHEALDAPRTTRTLVDFFQQPLHERPVAHVHLEQLVGDADAEAGQFARRLEFHLVEEDVPGEGVAVGVQAGGGDTDEFVAGADVASVEDAAFLDHADDGAADVILAGLVKAGHLRRLAADEGAVVLAATDSESAHDVGKHLFLQCAGADVVEEEQRLSADHGDVVDAMVDEILPDGVVAPGREGDLELGADAVHARDQHGVAVLAGVQREQPAKAADFAEHLGPAS